MSSYVNQEVLCCLALDLKTILAGIGGCVFIFKLHLNKPEKVIKVFTGQKVHLIKADVNKSNFVALGGKQVAVFNMTSVTKWHCEDWILDAIFISQHSDNDKLLLATSHNEIQLWDFRRQSCTNRITPNESCILYSCCLESSGTTITVFAGTVFSEVMIWQTDLSHPSESPIILHRLTGHKGVIFSICLGTDEFGHRLIVTSSDDRSVRVWLVDGCWSKANITPRPPFFGHTARVWKSLVSRREILSIGEDSQICRWSLNGHLRSQLALQQSGILSVCQLGDFFISGGSDGSILQISENMFSAFGPLENYVVPISFHEKEIPKRVKFFENGNSICLTSQGRILFENVSSNFVSCLQETEELLKCRDVTTSPCGKYIACCTSRGNIVLLDKDGNLVTRAVASTQCKAVFWSEEKILVQLTGGTAVLYNFVVETMDRLFDVEKIEEFFVTKSEERSASCFLCVSFEPAKISYIIGDRVGNLQIFREGNYKCVQTLKKVHSCLGVSNIVVWKEENAFLSTGGGGWVRQYKFDGVELSIVRSYKVSMEIGATVTIINGVPIIVGFHGVDLTLWSLTQRCPIASYNCGGGHRSYDIYTPSSDILTFLYIKDHSVNRIDIPVKQEAPIRVGVHGKTINSMEVIEADKSSFIISGSDDNTVRIAKYPQFETLHVIETHISSVRAVKTFQLSPDFYVIFSAGGRLQISASTFNVKTLECREIATHFLNGTAADGRYMCLAVIAASPDNISIAVGCSDCTIRFFVFNYKERTLQQNNCFIQYSRCITRVKYIVKSDLVYIAGFATDGNMVLWREEGDVGARRLTLNSTIHLHASGVNSVLLHSEDSSKECSLVTGGDDNAVIWSQLVFEPTTYTWNLLKQTVNDQLHSCQVTGIKRHQDFVITTSIDQRVIVHRVTEDGGFMTISDVWLTTVPDVQGIVVLHSVNAVCVFGKGIEIIPFIFDNSKECLKFIND